MTLLWGTVARGGDPCERHADCAPELRCVGHECVTQDWIDLMEIVVSVSVLVIAIGVAALHIRGWFSMRRPRGRMDRGVPIGWHRIDQPTFRQLRRLVDCGDGVVRTDCGWIRIEGRRILMGVGVQVRMQGKYRRKRSWPFCAAINLGRYPPTMTYRAPWVYWVDMLMVVGILLGGAWTTGDGIIGVFFLMFIGFSWLMYTVETGRFQRLLDRLPSAEEYVELREPAG